MASLATALSALLPLSAGGDVEAWAADPTRVGPSSAALKPLLRAMLNAGVRYSAAQQEAYAAIAADAAAQSTLSTLESTFGSSSFLGGTSPSSADGAVLGALYDLLSLGYPAIQLSHPGVAAWTAAVASVPVVSEALASRELATGGIVRVGGQVDLRAAPPAVAALADAAVARNSGHKKAQSQRDKEDAEKEAKKAPLPPAAAPAAAPASAVAPATPTQPAGNKMLPSLPVEERIALALSTLEKVAGVTGAPLVRHAAAENVEALLGALATTDGVKCKNLFVKAKKEKAAGDSRMWLVLAAHDTKTDLVGLATKLGYGKIVIRFADTETLLDNLGVAPGNVSPLALANDTALQVNVAVDAKLMAAGPDALLWFHPLTNEASVGLTPAQLNALIAGTGHAVTVVDFS